MSDELSDLTTPLTAAEFKQAIYDVVDAVGSDATSWKPGAIPRTIIAAVAILLASLSTLVSLIAKMGFLTLSEGAWKTNVARYTFNTPRQQATAATGPITVDGSASVGIFELDPDDVTLVGDNGVEYRNLNAFTLDPAETKSVVFYAVELGSKGTAAPNTITTLSKPSMTGVVFTNPAALVGLDEESDPDLESRALDQVGARSPNGPSDAYRVAGREAVRLTDGTLIGVTDVRTFPDSYGNIDVYGATASGAIPGDVADPDTDLGAFDYWVQRRAVPIGVTANCYSATTVVINPVVEIWVFDTPKRLQSDYEAAASSAIIGMLAGIPIGGIVVGDDSGKVFAGHIQSTVFGTFDQIFKVDVTTPDTELDADEKAIFGSLTLVVNRVPLQ